MTQRGELATADLRVLILAPVGRTGALARRALEEAGFSCAVCRSMAELCGEIEQGAGAALLLEEAFGENGDAGRLAGALEKQPGWSDLPVLVFVRHLDHPAPAFRPVPELTSGRSVLVLERPVRGRALVSLVAASLRNRERQYRLRDRIAELREARRGAEEANRSKGEFLAVMSHELRTPLNAIIGFADLLGSGISGPLTERQGAHVERILKSSWHLLGLVEEVLAFARLEAGREQLHVEPIDAAALTRDAIEFVRPRASSKGLRLEESLPSAPVPIETDARKLRQILLNLLSNAVKFTDRGQVEMRLAPTGDGWLVFQVCDTGRGIAPEDQAKIFEPFEQVDASLTRQSEGTGLGLGVSRKLAMLLGGDLSLESRLGEGSVFTVRLPCRLPVH